MKRTNQNGALAEKLVERKGKIEDTIVEIFVMDFEITPGWE